MGSLKSSPVPEDADSRERVDYQAQSAWRKALEATKLKWPQLTEDQAISQVIEEVYDKAKRVESAESYQPFVDEFLESYSAKEDLGPAPMARQPAPVSGAGVEAGAQTGRAVVIPDIQRKIPPYVPEEIEAKVNPAEAPPMASDPSAPMALRKNVKNAIEEIGLNAGRLMRWYSHWASERLRMHGGKAAAELADAIDIAFDREKQIYGSLTPAINPAKREVGKLLGPSAWLTGINKVTQDTGPSRFVDALEGRQTVPPNAQNANALVTIAPL